MFLLWLTHFDCLGVRQIAQSARPFSPAMNTKVESRMGAVAWGLWPTPRFPSPLIKPDEPISGIRLSDWLHRKAHGDKLTARGFGTMSNSPSPLDTAISGGACH
jgi:hypothetical protein